MSSASTETISLNYDAALAAELVALASLANKPIISELLPDGWQLHYKGSSTASSGGAQYFFASKQLMFNGQPQRVAALVVGAPWQQFIPYYIPAQNHVLQPFNSAILGRETRSDAQVDLGFSQMYAAIRTQLLADLLKVRANVAGFDQAMPLLCVGLGPGGPMAQLSAIDVRPGKTPVEGETVSPVTVIANYGFSSPAFADAKFPPLLQQLVGNSFRVQAAGDLFANAPNQSSGYYQAGIEKPLKLSIPKYDSPWFERDANYYAALLSGQNPADSDEDSGSVSSATGFNSALAFALAKLVAVDYQQFQHRGTTPDFNFKPYDLKFNLGDNNSCWLGLFESPDYLVIAARGAVTWAETLNNLCGSVAGIIPWADAKYGQYSNPLITLYDGFRDTMREQLNGLGNKPILLTGHSDGGALANLIALDLEVNPLNQQRQLKQIYTFGCTPAATLGFMGQFGELFKGKNFQVVRPSDVLPKIDFPFALFTIGQNVNLNGGSFDPANGSTYHALSSYIELLDPSS